MNRVSGDYFETLLYKIFVSIDENTTVAEVSFSLMHVYNYKLLRAFKNTNQLSSFFANYSLLKFWKLT